MLAQYFHSRPYEQEALEPYTRVGLKSAPIMFLHSFPAVRAAVCIARALINDPKIVLADEPTGNLDASTKRSCSSCCASCTGRDGTIVMVTHDR